MHPLLISLIMVAAVATIIVLFTGIGSMAHGGPYDDLHGEHLMFARVALQGLTVLLILLALLLRVL